MNLKEIAIDKISLDDITLLFDVNRSSQPDKDTYIAKITKSPEYPINRFNPVESYQRAVKDIIDTYGMIRLHVNESGKWRHFNPQNLDEDTIESIAQIAEADQVKANFLEIRIKNPNKKKFIPKPTEISFIETGNVLRPGKVFAIKPDYKEFDTKIYIPNDQTLALWVPDSYKN